MRRGGLGFGGAVGLGVALSLIVGVIAVGHAIFRQLTGAASAVVTFAEIAVCVLLGGVAVGALGWLGYRGQLARLHLAERRIAVEAAAAEAAGVGSAWAVRAEVLDGGAEGLCPSPAMPSIQGMQARTVLPSRHLRTVADPPELGPGDAS